MVPDLSSERAAERQKGHKSVSILGSTGSIGTQTLDIIRLFPERFRIHALSAGRNVDLLAQQAEEFRPRKVILADERLADDVRSRLIGTDTEVFGGLEALCQAASDSSVDSVVAAIVGAAGLQPVLAAIRAGKQVALANKETLVVAGAVIQQLLRTHSDAAIIPVDSEHSAIFQCLVGEPREAVEELILTASGGPFLTRTLESFHTITPAEALRHPNWDMGAKITIDSATMMNKGLEVIEARWLFDLNPEQIRVLIHPQSIIHSMVVFIDGSAKAQLGVPDMKVPIQYALSFPERWSAPHQRIDWKQLRQLEFEEPDLDRFPCLRLAYEAIETGGTAPSVLNAANEQAVSLFLAGETAFTEIPILIEMALERLGNSSHLSLEAFEEADHASRRLVKELSSKRRIKKPNSKTV